MIMKKIFKLILAAVILSVATVSCELEKFPYDQIEQTQAFQTMSDAATINNGMYAQMRSRIHGIFMFSTDVQADLLNATLDFGNRNGFPHRWEGFLAGDYTIRDTWQGYYSAMVNLNNIITNMGAIPTADATEKATLDRFIGEAHLMRAFYYHQLVQRWGKPYNAATAGSDLGVPLVLTFNPNDKPARATVQAVYDQILADIASAKSMLPAVTAAPASNSRLTRDAALALEARVLLHMGNWNGVIGVAQDLVNSGRYELINNEGELRAMWHNDISLKEVIFQVSLSAPSELGSVNNVYLGYVPSELVYTPDFIPQQWVVDMYAEEDIRRNIYLEEKPVRVMGQDYSGIILLNKFPGNPELFTTANTNYQHKPKVFRLAEVYLNLAEAQYHVNQGAALGTLNALRTARGLGALDVSGDALMNAIKEERTRELLGEGFRLNDLMRWNMPVVRSTPQLLDPIHVTPAEHYIGLNKPAGDNQFVWGIPSNDLTTNANMVQNPGW
jgi:starch-binding outer membrane protein, SusD/RagB family